MKKTEGWKTLFFAVVLALIGVLEQFDFTTIFDGDNQGWIISGIGLIVGLLRSITKKPMAGM